MPRKSRIYTNPFLKATVPLVVPVKTSLPNLQDAIALHQQGQLGQAEAIYRQILGSVPSNADALHLLGIIAHQTGQYKGAIELISKAIEVNPNAAIYYSNRGISLQQLKQFEAAVASYDKAIEIKPDYAEAYFNRGNSFLELKQFEAAAASYDAAIALRPYYAEAYSNRGISLQELKQFEASVNSYDKAIELKPDYAEAYYNRGTALKELEQLETSVTSYDKAIDLKPDYAEAYSNRGIALQELKQFVAAVASYDKAIDLKPDYAEAYSNRGISLQELKQLEAAIVSYDKAIELKLDSTEAYFNRGIAQQQLKQFKAAIASYDKAIELKPNYAGAYSNRGISLQGMNQFEAAVASYDKAIELKPELAEAYSNRGTALKELNRFNAAVISYDKAIELNPDYVDAYSNRGVALHELKQFAAAVASYDKAIELKPDYAQAYYNRGNALKELKRFQAAVASYDNAIKLKSDLAEAYSNRGISLQELKQLEAAVASYDKAIALKPGYAQAYSNRGTILKELKQFEAAIASYDKAIELKPDLVEAYFNRGNVLLDLKQLEAGVASYDAAIALKPDYEYLFGVRQHARMCQCDWKDFESTTFELRHKILNKEKVSNPFAVLAFVNSLADQRMAAETWSTDKYPFNPSLGPILKSSNKPKIRIGYFSADFRLHPVSILTVGLFEHHDKSKFELIAFSFGPEIHDEIRGRITRAFDRFIDVRAKSNEEVALISRELEVDIAIDLGGHTQDCRTGIFSFRAAPIQLSYIGYLGTMGASYYDYLIADQTLIPHEFLPFYSEKIVYLPSYQVNDSKQEISHSSLSRQELNLPSSGFVYCCFNANYKITPSTFDSWMRILKVVPESVLLLYTDIQSAAKNLKTEAEKRGVNPARLIFGEKLIRSKYLARCRSADLFLDTLPYNAGATASDALWAGLPVLTCMGESFASRYAASLLIAIGLPELVTQTQDEYEALAIELATNTSKLNVIKTKLERNRLTTALFDTPQFTKHIEAAYIKMYERYQADLPPEHIYIDA